MSVTIDAERPDSPDAVALILELEDHLAPLYPVESRHGFSVDRLAAEGVAFFVLRADGQAAACGGIHMVGTEYGELKRMYVRPAFRGRGYGRLLVERLTGYALARGAPLARLETGVHQRAAIGLYEGCGFYRVPPFGPYTDDPVSLCYEKRLV